ncbi:MAG: hypothetical protein IAI50_19635 [Candidatus Eremiobacteraeota bacterium]|nr:hypothetical protein [Candidatus Eremiobacteraeota bacterium]
MIEARAAGKETPKGEAPAKPRDNVVNLMDVLQRSLEQSKSARGEGKSSRSVSKDADEKPKKTTTKRKKSAA